MGPVLVFGRTEANEFVSEAGGGVAPAAAGDGRQAMATDSQRFFGAFAGG